VPLIKYAGMALVLVFWIRAAASRRASAFISVSIRPVFMQMDVSPRNPNFPVRLRLTAIGKVIPVSLQPQNIITATLTFQSSISSS